MKSSKLFSALILTSAFILGACSPKEVNYEQVTFEPNDLAAEISDHDADDYVKSLGDYSALTVYLPKATVSDSEIQSKINIRMYDYAEKIPVTSGAIANSVLAINYTVTVDGDVIEEDDSEEGYEILLGQADIGLESDKQLMGALPGDHLEYEVELTAAHGDDLAGKTAKYVVDVLNVYNYDIPEYTDEFVKTKTEYKNKKAFEKAIRAELMVEARKDAWKDAYQDALQTVVDNSDIDGYPQDIYDAFYAYYEESYEYTASMFGVSREDLISSYGLQKEVVAVLERLLVMEAIANEEGLALTDEEYAAYYADSVEKNSNYETVEDMEKDYCAPYMRMEALQNKVGSFLLNTATVYEAE